MRKFLGIITCAVPISLLPLYGAAQNTERSPDCTAIDSRTGQRRELATRPGFTPAHDTPRLIDSVAVIARIQDAASASGAGRPAQISLWTLVSSRGRVCTVQVSHGTADPSLDSVIASIWYRTEFTRPLLRYGPNRERERAVPYWRADTIRLRR